MGSAVRIEIDRGVPKSDLRVVLRSGRAAPLRIEKCTYLHRIFECTCRITLYTDNTYDSWLAHDPHSRQVRGRKAATLPKGAWGAQEACLCEPVRTGARQGPTAASSCQRLQPVAPADLGAAGTHNEHREGSFEPRTSTEIVLRKHEECDEESARWRVQGALEQLGRRGALVSGWAA